MGVVRVLIVPPASYAFAGCLRVSYCKESLFALMQTIHGCTLPFINQKTCPAAGFSDKRIYFREICKVVPHRLSYPL